jgi:hypothetical protein
MAMPENAEFHSLAVRRRRASRREEYVEQSKLAALLTEYLDPSCAWFTGLENKPTSALNGWLQRMRGCRSGISDILVLARWGGSTRVIFIEMKSIRGRISRAQKQMRVDVVPTGAVWLMARTARAALTGLLLELEGAHFRKTWTPPALEDWEGPFREISRLPVHPLVAAERREAKRRYRLRKEIREREAAQLAAARDGAGFIDARVKRHVG